MHAFHNKNYNHLKTTTHTKRLKNIDKYFFTLEAHKQNWNFIPPVHFSSLKHLKTSSPESPPKFSEIAVSKTQTVYAATIRNDALKHKNKRAQKQVHDVNSR